MYIFKLCVIEVVCNYYYTLENTDVYTAELLIKDTLNKGHRTLSYAPTYIMTILLPLEQGQPLYKLSPKVSIISSAVIQ